MTEKAKERELRKKFHYHYKTNEDFRKAVEKAIIDRPKMNFRKIIDESLKLNPAIAKYLE